MALASVLALAFGALALTPSLELCDNNYDSNNVNL